MTTADLVAVQRAVSVGQWRHSVQAEDWVGKAIAQTIGLTLEDKNEKDKPVTGLVSGAGGAVVRNGNLLLHLAPPLRDFRTTLGERFFERRPQLSELL